MTQIQIPTDAMRDIVAKAVLENLAPDQRDLLIQAAIEYLITAPPKGGYGSIQQPSPLQHAFDMAVSQAAQEVVKEVVEGELRERIRGLIREKATEALEQDSTLAYGIGQAVGEQVEKALRGNR